MPSHNWWSAIQQTALDLLFPPTDRSRFVRQLNTEAVDKLPRAEKIQTDYLRAAFDYQHKTTRAIVQAAKYDSSHKAANIMGQKLYDELLSFCEEHRVISKSVGLVPIPLSNKRYQQRGFNQCRRIIRSILQTADSTDHFKERSVLEKTRQTKPQASLRKNQRQQNIKGCFRIRPGSSVESENLIIIDDVTTTGATIKEAKQVLEAGNPESILALAFAH